MVKKKAIKLTKRTKNIGEKELILDEFLSCQGFRGPTKGLNKINIIGDIPLPTKKSTK